jgi:hypothetical protein
MKTFLFVISIVWFSAHAFADGLARDLVHLATISVTIAVYLLTRFSGGPNHAETIREEA